MELSIAVKQSNLDLTSEVTTENLVFYSAIGNQWSFDSGLTLGCDWIAVSIPITKAWKSTLITTGFSESEINSLQSVVSDLGVRISKISAASIGILSFGYRF